MGNSRGSLDLHWIRGLLVSVGCFIQLCYFPWGSSICPRFRQRLGWTTNRLSLTILGLGCIFVPCHACKRCTCYASIYMWVPIPFSLSLSLCVCVCVCPQPALTCVLNRSVRLTHVGPLSLTLKQCATHTHTHCLERFLAVCVFGSYMGQCW